MSYSFFLLSLIVIGVQMNFNKIYFIIMFLIGYHLFIVQIKNLNIKKSINCLKIFKSNNSLGMIVFITLLIGKISFN